MIRHCHSSAMSLSGYLYLASLILLSYTDDEEELDEDEEEEDEDDTVSKTASTTARPRRMSQLNIPMKKNQCLNTVLCSSSQTLTSKHTKSYLYCQPVKGYQIFADV